MAKPSLTALDSCSDFWFTDPFEFQTQGQCCTVFLQLKASQALHSCLPLQVCRHRGASWKWRLCSKAAQTWCALPSAQSLHNAAIETRFGLFTRNMLRYEGWHGQPVMLFQSGSLRFWCRPALCQYTSLLCSVPRTFKTFFNCQQLEGFKCLCYSCHKCYNDGTFGLLMSISS